MPHPPGGGASLQVPTPGGGLQPLLNHFLWDSPLHLLLKATCRKLAKRKLFKLCHFHFVFVSCPMKLRRERVSYVKHMSMTNYAIHYLLR